MAQLAVVIAKGIPHYPFIPTLRILSIYAISHHAAPLSV